MGNKFHILPYVYQVTNYKMGYVCQLMVPTTKSYDRSMENQMCSNVPVTEHDIIFVFGYYFCFWILF